jgi:hypothetical protein
MWEMIEERCVGWGFIADARSYNWHTLNVLPNYMLGVVQPMISKHYTNFDGDSIINSQIYVLGNAML